MEGCDSHCWLDPVPPSEGRGSSGGLRWRIWDALGLDPDLQRGGRGEMAARLVCSSRFLPLWPLPIDFHFPKGVVPPLFGATHLRGTSVGFPVGQGAAGGMF